MRAATATPTSRTRTAAGMLLVRRLEGADVSGRLLPTPRHNASFSIQRLKMPASPTAKSGCTLFGRCSNYGRPHPESAHRHAETELAPKRQDTLERFFWSERNSAENPTGFLSAEVGKWNRRTGSDLGATAHTHAAARTLAGYITIPAEDGSITTRFKRNSSGLAAPGADNRRSLHRRSAVAGGSLIVLFCEAAWFATFRC